MTVKFLSSLFVLCCLSALYVAAQDTAFRKPGLAAETRVTTYLQGGGYDLGIYYHPENTRFSFGLLGAGHDINSTVSELIFDSNGHDQLDIRLNWLVSVITRYHFAKHGEGFFVELGIGAEEFRVSSGNGTITNRNGFVSPSIAYTWYPWRRSGFYVLPKLTGNFILFRPDEQVINASTTFRLKPVFAAPSIAIGWKFDFK